MADKDWLGIAVDSKQTTDVAVTGSWVATNTAKITIGDADLIITLGSGTWTTTEVATALAAAVNAASATAGITDTETRNFGGREFGEFRDVVATSSSNTLTLTSATAGVDFTATFTGSGSGTFGSPSTTAATGKNWFNNAENWVGGVAPGGSDVACFKSGSVHCLRGLNSIANLAGVRRTGGYNGNIGLSFWNYTHSGYTYREYRNRYLQAIKSVGPTIIEIGDGSGNSQGRTNIYVGATTAHFFINDSARQGSDGRNPIEIKGLTLGGIELYQINGNSDLGERDAATLSTEVEHVKIWGGTCRLEATMDIDPTTEMVIHGGVVESHCDLSEFDGTGDLVIHQGGTLIHYEGACPDVEVYGGTLDYRSSGNITGDIDLYDNSILTFANNPQTSITLTADIKFRGKNLTFKDPRGVAIPNSDYHFIGCSINDVKGDWPKDYKYAPTAL